MSATSCRVTCLQLTADDDEPRDARIERVLGLVDDAAPHSDLIVLPELWATGYFAFDRYAEDAEPRDGALVAALAERAARHEVHLAGGSFVERDGDDLYNTSVILGPDGRLLHAYRKIHLFGYGSREARLLTPGVDVGVFDTPFGAVGVTTCYDLRFPELFRAMVDAGLEMLIIVAAWPAARREHWRTLLRARAIENQVHLIAANMAGSQGEVELAGASAVIGPWGDVVADAGEDPTTLTVTIDPGDVARVREEFPVLEHRRLPR